MPEPAKKTRLTDRKRDAILSAAVEVFRENGYDRAKVDRIAEVASVSKRTVYNHFSSKEELFVAIVNKLKQQAGSLDDFLFDPARTPREQLVDLSRKVVELLTAEDFIGLARVIVSRFLQAPDLAKETFRSDPPYQEGLENWLKAAAENGVITLPDPKIGANQLLSILKGDFFWPTLIASDCPPADEEAEKAIERSVDMFLSYYRPAS